MKADEKKQNGISVLWFKVCVLSSSLSGSNDGFVGGYSRIDCCLELGYHHGNGTLVARITFNVYEIGVKSHYTL